MSYNEWIIKNEPTTKMLLEQRNKVFEYSPIISVIVPVFNPPEKYLSSLISSVLNQTYPHFELCFADASNGTVVRQLLYNFQKKDKRVKVKLLNKNLGIVGNTNEALALSTGEYLCFLDHDDMLAPFALYEIVDTINSNRNVDLIYSDEDFISDDNHDRKHPHFKPDWSPDTLRSHNYITHLMTLSRSVIDKVGGMHEGFDGAQDHDLVLRASEVAEQIIHIPKILYHWRQWQGSTASNPKGKSYANEAGKKAVKEHLNRLHIPADVVNGKGLFYYKPIYKLRKPPKVSIIIPNSDHVDDLDKCLSSILTKTLYKNYEIFVVENGSKDKRIFRFYQIISQRYPNNVKIIRYVKPQFNFSDINNFAVKYTKGDILLFLNNDIEVINKDWLNRMVEHAARPDIGAVGAKMYYPDGRIQHAGIIIGIGGYAAHGHRNFAKDHPGYFGKLNIIHNVSAVTGACLMMRREVFEEVGGFDTRFVIAVNDVDLCLRVREAGYLNVFTPFAEMIHHESKTRGYEDTPEKMSRFAKELALFTTKWGKVVEAGDPFYNPNLTLSAENYGINVGHSFDLQEKINNKVNKRPQVDITRSRSLKIHVLYSHGFDSKPHFFSDIRLLRPLTHPSLVTTTNVTYGVTYRGVTANVVILDRLWKPSVNMEEVKRLVQDMRHNNTCFIYHLDDNLIDSTYANKERKEIIKFLMKSANGIIFSTEGLKERFSEYNNEIHVIPNALDEKLINKDRSIGIPDPVQKDIIIGYMGTPTHDNDLKMILPAVQNILKKYDNTYFEVVGALRDKKLVEHLPRTDVIEITSVRYYPNFWQWMNQNMYWDIGIAPLEDTIFNRSKSDIKFLDYSALGIPGVYSMVKPYQHTVKHNETGILTINTVDAWIKALEHLVENPDIRHQLSRNAYQYLMKHRTLSMNAYKWKEAIEIIYKNYKIK